MGLQTKKFNFKAMQLLQKKQTLQPKTKLS